MFRVTLFATGNYHLAKSIVRFNIANLCFSEIIFFDDASVANSDTEAYTEVDSDCFEFRLLLITVVSCCKIFEASAQTNAKGNEANRESRM